MSGGFSGAPPTGAEAERLAAGVGAMLTAARAVAGLTKAGLSARSGVSASTISGIERGRSRPRWATLVQLAGALHAVDPAAAVALAERLAEAAGPSLAGDPLVPAGVARELVVVVLTRAARRLGIDVDDERARAVVADELRAVAGEDQASSGSPDPVPVRGVVVPAVEGRRVP